MLLLLLLYLQWFRSAATREELMPDHLSELLFTSLDRIYDFHCAFLKEIETRLHMWSALPSPILFILKSSPALQAQINVCF